MSANQVEKLVYWYLRFNGYLTVENFTVHPDHKKEPEAEADILAVRFHNSKEEPEGYCFERDGNLILPDVTDFIIGEVKSGMCAVNENSWGDSHRKHVEYALEWMGFLPDDPKAVSAVADELYKNRTWSDDSYSVRFVCFGNRENEELSKTYSKVKQILLSHMMDFVVRRLTTGCNALHRENWDSYIREIAMLIEIGASPDMLLRWTLQKGTS